MGITIYKAGANDTIDNDVEILSAMTAIIHLDTQQVITLIDAGLVPNSLASLPVELSSFTGSSSNCSNYLQWATASENNVEMFAVQRAQKDNDFVTIENISPVGANGIVAKYAFEDQEPKDKAQYRLKIIDLDGTFEYSKIIAVDLACNQGNISDVVIYPNPTQNTSTLEFEVDKSLNTQLRIFDNSGRIITEENIFIHKGPLLAPP